MFKIKIHKKIGLLYRWAFTDFQATAAIDLTNRCNLKCTHCYWWKEERPPELDDEAMIAFMKKLRKSGIRSVTLYGGEPMLRANICEEATRIFDFTIIFTNGTQPYPSIDARWLLSLDGTREIHDKIRGEGVYDTIMENLKNAPRKPIVHTTITRQNQHHIEEFLEELTTKPVMGVGFSFYTPHRGQDEDDIFISLDERDKILDDLLRLKKKYWRIMGFSKKMAYQLRQSGGFSEWNSSENCSLSEMCRCYNSDGTIKPCTYGKDADCTRCGCLGIVSFRAAFKYYDPQALFFVSHVIY